jgi:hypothetical protein
MFDTHTPYQFLVPYSFNFQAHRFEEWKNGKMISEGKPIEFSGIVFTANKTEEDEYISVMALDDEFEKLVDFFSTNFEKVFTLHDRIILVSIPPPSNKDIAGILALRETSGVTRFTADFGEKEPYCCSLYTIKGEVFKITFSFSNPERIVEFYK